jgi:hypothetical protein
MRRKGKGKGDMEMERDTERTLIPVSEQLRSEGRERYRSSSAPKAYGNQRAKLR